jgi:hypothetical protein
MKNIEIEVTQADWDKAMRLKGRKNRSNCVSCVVSQAIRRCTSTKKAVYTVSTGCFIGRNWFRFDKIGRDILNRFDDIYYNKSIDKPLLGKVTLTYEKLKAANY